MSNEELVPVGRWERVTTPDSMLGTFHTREELHIRDNQTYTYVRTYDAVYTAPEEGKEEHEHEMCEGKCSITTNDETTDGVTLTLTGEGSVRWRNKPSPLMSASLAFLDETVSGEQAHKDTGVRDVTHVMELKLPLSESSSSSPWQFVGKLRGAQAGDDDEPDSDEDE